MTATPQNPQLQVKEITDIILRKNFQNLFDYFQKQNQFLNFQFLEMNFTSAVTAQPIAHTLGIIPQDVIVTKVTGSGTATFLHGQFTSKNMYITTSGPCRIRFFYGTYFNFQSQVNNAATDVTSYSPTSSTLSGTAGKAILSLVSLPLLTVNASTSNYNMSVNDDIVEINSANLTNFSITLATAASMTGRMINIMKIGTDSKVVTIKTAIPKDQFNDGTVSKIITLPTSNVQLFSDGTVWRIINSYLFFQKTPTVSWAYGNAAGQQGGNGGFSLTTYILPVGCSYIRVKMVGAGGGGGGSGNAGGSNGASAGNSSFGSWVVGGGIGGTSGPNGAGVGGTQTFTSTPAGKPSFLFAYGQGGESGGAVNSNGQFLRGGGGGVSFWGGGGQAAWGGGTGATNFGSGGGGGGNTAAVNLNTGSGGGAGAFLDFLLPASDSSFYIYGAATPGAGGAAATNGFAGGTGQFGVIFVEEYYT